MTPSKLAGFAFFPSSCMGPVSFLFTIYPGPLVHVFLLNITRWVTRNTSHEKQSWQPLLHWPASFAR